MYRGFRFGQPHRLLVLFVAATLVPSLALAWLGWQFVQQDRALEGQRLGEALQHAAETVAASAERELARVERDLPDIYRDGAPASWSNQATVVRLDESGHLSWTGAPLLFVPVSERLPEPPDSLWAPGEHLEFVLRDLVAVEAAYRTLALSADPAVRAGALVRLARVERLAGRPDDALATYADLSTLAPAAVLGIPADLVARWARLDVLNQLGRRSQLQEEGAALARDLREARWRLDRVAYEVYAEFVRPYGPSASASLVALADAVDTAWHDHERRRTSGVHSRTRRILTTDAGPVLLITLDEPDSWTAFAASSEYVDAMRRDIGASPDTLVAFLDDEGRAVAGGLPDVPADWVVRIPRTDSGLPWTTLVSATPALAAAADTGRARSNIVLAGIALLVVLIPMSAYLVTRTIQRDLALARQQAGFVAAVSHEFRSPLTALTHLTDLLGGEFEPNEARRQQYYSVLSRETGRLRRFVDTLLEFGRIQAGASRYRLSPLDVLPFLQTVTDEFRKDSAADKRQVSCSGRGPLPAVAADAEALGRAVWNLLENAVKYSPSGSPVNVVAEADGAGVAIRVTDQGAGVADDERDAIFQQFYRGKDTEQSAVKGTGVGLAMVDHIVSHHGGRVQLETSPGAGSTFSILLPAVSASPKQASRHAS